MLSVRARRVQMTYHKVFQCAVQAAVEMFDVKLVVKAMVSDKSSPARNAARAVFGPDVKLILCWPHISRGVRVRSAGSYCAFTEALTNLLECINDVNLSGCAQDCARASTDSDDLTMKLARRRITGEGSRIRLCLSPPSSL